MNFPLTQTAGEAGEGEGGGLAVDVAEALAGCIANILGQQVKFIVTCKPTDYCDEMGGCMSALLEAFVVIVITLKFPALASSAEENGNPAMEMIAGAVAEGVACFAKLACKWADKGNSYILRC